MDFNEHKDQWGNEIYNSRTVVTSLSSPVCKTENQQLLWHNYKVHKNSNVYDDNTESSNASQPISLPNNLETYDGKTNHKPMPLYSWTEMYGCLKHSESQCSTVPSLELCSKSSTLDYLRDLDGIKLMREPDMAFENWCASKQRLQQQQLQIQRAEMARKLEEAEDRKQLAKSCYEKWLRDKKEQAMKNHQKNICEEVNLRQISMDSNATVKSGNLKTKVRNVSQTEIRQVVQCWWLKKKEQQQQRNKEKERRLLKKRIEEQNRKKLVEEAWQNWISTVQNKPKPVPFNQGMKSLRGTISPIYINPEPWKPIKDITQQDQTGKNLSVYADNL